jgi:hypothetical protein
MGSQSVVNPWAGRYAYICSSERLVGISEGDLLGEQAGAVATAGEHAAELDGVELQFGAP